MKFFSKNSKIFTKTQASSNICQKSRKFLIKKILNDVLNDSLSKAILKLLSSPSVFVRVFWCIGLIFSSGLCSYFLIESILVFFTYKLNTTFRTYVEVTSTFPKVTFCNKNTFTTKFAFEMAHDSKYNDFLYRVNNEFNDSQRDQINHSLDDILLECTFNSEKCYPKDFRKEYDKILGHCYSFNSGFDLDGKKIPLKSSIRAGSSYGLKLTLYVNFYEKLLPLNGGNAFNLYTGAIIIIGNSSFEQSKFGIELAPGLKTNIQVNRVIEKALPKPYSNCDIDNNNENYESNSDLYNLIANSNFQYSQQMCYEVCAIRQVIAKCNCTQTDKFSLFINENLCKINDPCATNVLKSFISDDFLENVCLKDCPLECNRTRFETRQSSVLYHGGDDLFNKIKSNPRLREDFLETNVSLIPSIKLKESVVRLFVFYDSLSYTESSDNANAGTILELVASIGGVLNLFMGISVLNVFEVLEVVISIVLILVRKNSEKTTNT